MSFLVSFEPLTTWPAESTPAHQRQPPQFKASYDDTLRLLRAELGKLDTSGAVALQVVTRGGAADLRRDGMLAQRATVVHPGVRISFTCKHGDLTYATDAYETRWGQTPSWQHNLRAIALGLKALRDVDRYGISGSGEQYRGWQQIASTGSAGMSRDIAVAVLAEEAGVIRDAARAILAARSDVLPKLVKTARRNAHPDANKGDRTRWDALMTALTALELSE